MNLKVSDARREDGFTLIELLVVVIIIGILAAIAIPVFLNQREKARDSAVQSALRSAATYQEIEFTEGGGYTAAIADLEAQGFRSGENIWIISTVDGATPPTTYCLQAVHAGDAGAAADAAAAFTAADADRIWALTIDPTDAGSGAPVQNATCTAGSLT